MIALAKEKYTCDDFKMSWLIILRPEEEEIVSALLQGFKVYLGPFSEGVKK